MRLGKSRFRKGGWGDEFCIEVPLCVLTFRYKTQCSLLLLFCLFFCFCLFVFLFLSVFFFFLLFSSSFFLQRLFRNPPPPPHSLFPPVFLLSVFISSFCFSFFLSFILFVVVVVDLFVLMLSFCFYHGMYTYRFLSFCFRFI